VTQPRDKACAQFGDQLTAYLDGELTDDRLSAVRGHLRECEGCRQAAADLAIVRDGLRELAPVDPPPSLWAGVQAQLAAREVEDAHRPSWRRALLRWLPVLPRYGGIAIVCAAAAVFLLWRATRTTDVVETGKTAPAIATNVPATDPATTTPITPAIAQPVCPPSADLAVATVPATPVTPVTPSIDDDTADVATAIAADPARTTASYTAATSELLGLACGARGDWTPTHRDTFDSTVTKLRGEIASAAPGRAQDKARRALVRYLQDAVVRDEIAAIDHAHDSHAFAGTRGAP
jgi:predicted anti-sigma-YlaC factor YlaD